MKLCNKCFIIKPLDQFGKFPRNRDGLRHTCKACRIIEERCWMVRIQADPIMANKYRAYHRDWQQAHPRKYDPKTKTAVRKWCHNNKMAVRAHCKAFKAQKRGKIQKPDACPKCGDRKRRLEKHHPDYSKPLEIQWLCSRCHGETRRKKL